MKFFFILAIIFFLGCSKSSNTNNPGGNNQTDGWTLGSKSYNTVYTYRSTTIFSGTFPAKSVFFQGQAVVSDTNRLNSCAVTFLEFPTVSKDYDIVGEPNLLTTAIGASECIVYASGSKDPLMPYPPSYSFYSAIGVIETGKKAHVTVTGGKIQIEIPQITLKNSYTTSPSTQTFSGTLIER